MLRNTTTGKIRLPNGQANLLRRKAASNGEVVNNISTTDEALEACVKAMPDDEVEKMLAFMENQLSK